jgi:hypothetical protein
VNTACDMPIMKAPTKNTPRWCVHAHSAIASALQAAAATMAHRSPLCIVINDAGMLLTNDPTPINMTTSAATATEAPSSRALSGTIGRMAPSARPNSSDGAKAGTAMRRREKVSGGTGGGATGIRRASTWLADGYFAVLLATSPSMI